MGAYPYGLQEVEKQIDALNPEYDELEDKVLSLQNRLETARMNPESTAEVQKAERGTAACQREVGTTDRRGSTDAGTAGCCRKSD